ncbi:MAG: hypothetical protein L0Y72_26795 [Gemmataceae bacterium]|nr:hypothetical protein [Gemmataceae bacterium]MCI0742658.1 hypothetical protein [Gemmataceae bacterium]
MSSVILDADLRAKLNGLNERVHVYDESGNQVGVFLPLDQYQKYLHKTVEVPFTDEQLEEFRKSGKGCSLDEIWQRLGVN